MKKRPWVLFVLVIGLFVGVLVRLWMIVDSQPAQVAATQNRWTLTVAQSRGTIYDRHRVPLVNETHEYRAAIAPSEALLSHVYSATQAEDFTMLRDHLVSGMPAIVRLIKPVGFTDGLSLFWVPKRYSERLLAPHVIGYLDSGGQNGVTGIEYGYNDLLAAYGGKATASFYVDGGGRYLAGMKPATQDSTARSVGGVVLTLDKAVQNAVEEIGSLYLKKGAIVVLSPDSGDIVALASFPSFQPHSIMDSIAADDGALLNRALSLYDCGSVFKIVTTAAALEHGVPAAKTYTCNGYLDVEGTRFHCHNRLGHSKLTMTEAFAQSCNLYYIQLAQSIGAESLYKTAQALKLDRQLSPAESLIAASAVLPDLDTIAASEAALANFSFGQGYLLSTPLHIARLTAAVANDGIMPPITLISGTVDENSVYTASQKGRGERVLSVNTAKILQNMLRETVKVGTGIAAQPQTVTASGKTGTAQTGQINADGNSVVQSWFTGCFPAENPQYIVTVLAEDADSSNVKSTVIFREIADKITLLTN